MIPALWHVTFYDPYERGLLLIALFLHFYLVGYACLEIDIVYAKMDLTCH